MGRGVLAQQTCRKGGEGSMDQDCGPWMFNGKIVLSNIDCGISKQASLQNTDHYTDKHLGKYGVQFRKLVGCIVGLHRAQIGEHNRMIFCVNETCAWITGPMPSGISFKKCIVNIATAILLPSHRNATRVCVLSPRVLCSVLQWET